MCDDLLFRKEREAKEAQDDSPAPVPVTKESSNDELIVKKLNKKRSFPEERDFTEEQEDFKGFFKGEDGGSGAGNKYDPMSIFKAKVAGDEVPAAEASENLNMDDVGEIKDGLVVFGEDTEAEKGLFNVGKMKVNKVYHSSSEDEEEKEEKTKAVKPKKKTKAAEDKKSAEFKEKMTKRFLQKQKESEELEVQKVAAKEKAKARKKAVNKYYSDSDDESEGETKAADDDESEGENKVGTEVLEKLETFAGDVWRDSDEEQDNAEDAVKYNPMSIFQAKLREGGDEVVAAEDGTGVVTSSDEEESDEEESDEEEKVKDVKDEKVKEVEEDESDEDDEEDDEEEEEEKEAEVAKVEDKVEFGTSTMVRYDPTSEEQDKFLRTDPEDTAGIEKTGDKASKGFFNVTTDLKKAFTSAKASSDGGGGFSFGFSKEPEKAAVEAKSMEVDDDDYNEGDGEEVVKKTDDAVASFGLQLRGKGVATSKEPFFFLPDDPRLEVGLDFFFNHEVDLDKLREKWDQEVRNG